IRTACRLYPNPEKWFILRRNRSTRRNIRGSPSKPAASPSDVLPLPPGLRNHGALAPCIQEIPPRRSPATQAPAVEPDNTSPSRFGGRTRTIP
ncbi:MAG TPA: hypothetical protein PLL14_08600, partial [Accumulibacter sp.]|nr:hypothetical protein [Accumulibacter sp.]